MLAKNPNNKGELAKQNGISNIKYMEVKTPPWFNSSSLQEIDISIIIPCYKSKKHIAENIASWDLSNKNLKTEIIYVDDACPEQTHLECVKCWNKRINDLKSPVGKCFLVFGKNSGFANACNIGAKEARGKYLLFLNADTKLTKNWLQPMYESFKLNEKIGVVGNVQLSENNYIESCGSEWLWSDYVFHHIGKHIYNQKKIDPFKIENAPKDILTSRKVEMTNGSCFMISKNLFNQIDGFDTEYKIGYWEDSDLCMKVSVLGYKIWLCAESIIYHYGCHSGQSNNKYYNDNKKLFYKKWIRTKFLNCYLEDQNKLDVNKENSVVYTAITNKYDCLRNHNPKDIDYVAFVDNDMTSKHWNIKQVCNEFSDPNRNAKIHKILSHVYFPEKKYSLWIDGSIEIKFPWSMRSFFESYLSDCDMVVFKHEERNCVYEEAKICCEMNLDCVETIKKQMERYKNEKIKQNMGLSECSVILRKHNEKTKEFNEIWWREICNGSKRDQLSFDYAVKKSGIKLRYFPGHLPHNNLLFDRDIHKPYVFEIDEKKEKNIVKKGFINNFLSIFKVFYDIK